MYHLNDRNNQMIVLGTKVIWLDLWKMQKTCLFTTKMRPIKVILRQCAYKGDKNTSLPRQFLKAHATT